MVCYAHLTVAQLKEIMVVGSVHFAPENRDGFAAAFAFRFSDLHKALSENFVTNFKYFAKSLILLESSDDDRYVLFADLSGTAITVADITTQSHGEFSVDPVQIAVPVYALTRDEVKSGESPQNGLRVDFTISSGGQPISYEIGTFEEALQELTITTDDVLKPHHKSLEELQAGLASASKWVLGARRRYGSLDTKITGASPEILAWVESVFPEYNQAIVNTIFADTILVDNVASGIMPSVQLTGAVESFWETRDNYPNDPFLIIGSETAALLAPDCPTPFSTGYIDPDELDAAKNSVVVSGDEITFNAIKIASKSLLSQDFIPARRSPHLILPAFALWLSKPLLSKTFDARIGKNMGAMLGIHKKGRAAIFKWWASGAWILESLTGSLSISLDPAKLMKLSVKFKGRTKFDALGYVDLECITYELGSFDAFHEHFDFTVGSSVYASPNGKLVLVAGFEDVYFDKWRSFIRFFFDRYNISWQGLIIEFVAKYILGEMLKRFVENKINSALGSLSLELFDFTTLPVVGDIFHSAFSSVTGNPGNLAPLAVGYESGIEVLVGFADG